MPQPGDIVGGKYRLLRLIGAGGMGSVYEAENMVTGKRLAVKLLHPDPALRAWGIERLLREGRAAARICHPNVVDVYDVERDGETMFLVMELLQGETLASFLARERVTVPILLGLLLPAMRGVAEAHRQGVIHRDIKPENIFLARELDSSRPVPKVLDFGVARFDDTGLLLTRTGYAVGTPRFMSLEQLRGGRDLDARADVYSFGVILYMALAGRPPFPAESLAELVIAMMSSTPVPPHIIEPALPRALSDAVMHAIAIDRTQRTPSIEQLITDLTPFAEAPSGARAPAHGEPDWVSQELGRAGSALTHAVTVTPRASEVAPRLHVDPSDRTSARARTLPTRSEPIPRSVAIKHFVLGASGAALLLAGATYWVFAHEPSASTPASQVTVPALPAARDARRGVERGAREATAQSPLSVAPSTPDGSAPDEDVEDAGAAGAALEAAGASLDGGRTSAAGKSGLAAPARRDLRPAARMASPAPAPPRAEPAAEPPPTPPPPASTPPTPDASGEAPAIEPEAPVRAPTADESDASAQPAPISPAPSAPTPPAPPDRVLGTPPPNPY